ncbi:glycoside hydrolase family 9 protein [Streptomyces sp. ST2-7A]|uniref:glycoside hydrolase family 9 protein n=1 Tax=Streptomyces sp. ST2-7A TaxID=2907214 RepID=UPI0035ABBEF5
MSAPGAGRTVRRLRRGAIGTAAAVALLGGTLAVPALADEPEEPTGPDLIVNGDFAAGTTGWWWTANTEGVAADGRMCLDIPGGTVEPWDAIVGQDGLPLTAGETYALTFTAESTVPIVSRTNVQLAVDPWTQELGSVDVIGPEPETFTHVFTPGADHDAAQLAYQIGGSEDPFTFCLSGVSLRGGAEQQPYEPDTGSPVRVNQVGYLTDGPKRGTVVTDAVGALGFTVRDADGAAVASGTTVPLGEDPTSRQNVHGFGFSELDEAGEGYTVEVDGEVSIPFAIGDDLYSDLRSDALAYFYHNRSGIEIRADLVGEEYARPAGHVDVAPNRGDGAVPCRPGQCDYTLDVTGGWYDAGDHGKYVVNGGISVAQVMANFERTLHVEGANDEPLGDGALRVPERGNGVPDILDEARWQMDFLMRMQVPAGEPLAGMAHHKMHDRNWTGMPMLPHQDPQIRELAPPSTAATLNLAASAAQCARLFEPYDADFAARCLEVAETAWDAAVANPTRYASPNDGQGGGAYSDNDVTDEFYWAAAELFITTGDAGYRAAVLDSPIHGDLDATFPRGGFAWADTAALGALNLAVVPNDLTDGELAAVRALLLEAADRYAADSAGTAYGLPFDATYVWGSNSQVLNNMIVLATAHDLTGEDAYRDAALGGWDYLLGRNPLNLSYVTGYGERYAQNQHHRHWARQLNPNLPYAAPGSVAGGPNSALQDPIAQRLLTGCAPAMCYIDHIESYATNEVTINWNAPLAWMASWADDLATGSDGGGDDGGGDDGGGDDGGGDDGGGDNGDATCEVTWTAHRWNNGFTAEVRVRNTGDATISPWELRWSFSDDQRITQAWSAEVTQSGRDVVARPAAWNAVLAPGAEIGFGFLGTSGSGATDPTAFTLGGAACATG